MIRVVRGPTPQSLDGHASAGGQETADAIRAISQGLEFKDFSAYKGADVVAALRDLFHRKCAYCEARYVTVAPVDVEHFRPKNAVVIAGRLAKPGYYWLAADWNNLLPSCIDCNRKRTQEFADGSIGMAGKANLFPVVDELLRWRRHDDGNREQPLLLDPCADDPEAHLEFFRDGSIGDGLVRPAIVAGTQSSKGRASIDAFGLQRRDLVEERMMKLAQVRAAIERALRFAERAELADDPDVRRTFEEEARQCRTEAYAYLAPNQPFLAATRAIFREYGLPVPGA
jgi:uncharacterized protein (TIGR02646 family)